MALDTSRPRRIASAVLVALVAAATAGLVTAAPSGAVASVTTQRIFGSTRYGTAQAIATDAAMGTPTGAIVATGQNYPDALAASALAGASGPSPIILTQSTSYTAEAKAALASLKAKGVSAVTVVGGTAAVSEAVKNAIAADGFTVTRVSGADRYATAAAIAVAANAKQVGGGGSLSGLKTAIFATGENFPDALAGGPMAERNDFPILLVTAAVVPQTTRDAIASLGIKNAIILGGTTAVSTAVQTQLATLTGDTSVVRLSGANRYATAAAIGDFEAVTLTYPMSTVVLATGVNFPDALAAGVLAGVVGGAIVLTAASLPGESTAFLDKYSASISKIVVAGGTTAVSDADVAAAKAAAQTTSNDVNLTGAPELVRVEAAGTDSGTNGPILRFVFDEALSSAGLVPGSFKAWTPYGESAVGTTAVLDSANSSAVLVTFPATSTVTVNEATVYTVAGGAALDAGSLPSIEGEVSSSVGRTFNDTNTRAPDLVSATAVTGETYDLTFDTAITAISAGSFRIVDTDGLTRSSTTAVVQTDTSVVRVTFTGTPATGFAGSRVVALAGAVTGSTALGGVGNNVVETKVISGRSAGTDSPDLVSVTVGSTGNQATFTFDEAVETMSGTGAQGTAAGFHLIYRNGTIATASSAERTSSTVVTAVFGTVGGNAVNELLAGAYVDDAAIARLGSTTATKPNRNQQVGITRSFEPGTFLGPKLTSATKATVTSGSTTTGYRITYVFDQPLTATLTQGGAAGFFVVNADGVRTAITASYCSRSSLDSTNATIICDSSTTTDTTSAAAVAMSNAKVATVGANTVTGSTVRTVGGSAFSSTTVNHEEISVV